MQEIWSSLLFLDLIKMRSRKACPKWRKVYGSSLSPIDPGDVGSSYKEAIRVNSQSGKGGVGFLLEEHYGISLPRELLVEFATMVQQLTEQLDREVKTDEIYDSLISNYIVESGPYKLVDYDLLSGKDQGQRCVARVEISNNLVTIDGEAADQ